MHKRMEPDPIIKQEPNQLAMTLDKRAQNFQNKQEENTVERHF